MCSLRSVFAPRTTGHMTSPAPHPIPYQGSKRILADRILATVQQRHFRTLYEPFAGSAAISIAACRRDIADTYVLSDSFEPLARLWQSILAEPRSLADRYEAIWHDQHEDAAAHFFRVRDSFNEDGDPAKLLYLLARCVKNSPRFNQRGEFNQSPDHRRRGMTPRKMRNEILGVWHLMHDRTRAFGSDFEAALEEAGPEDLVYMDPPWQGTTYGVDKRYHAGVGRERIVAALHNLNDRGIPFLLSYDGRCGTRTYGERLPDSVRATLVELPAGRSSQSTLAGRAERTVESLYVSSGLAADTPPQATASCGVSIGGSGGLQSAETGNKWQ